jgi:long-chain-acyl-CoA dehydrogenase
MSELPLGRLTIGVHACAHSEFMFEETKQYVMQRKAKAKHFPTCRFTLTLCHLPTWSARPYIISFFTQTIQHKLAEMKTEIFVARAFIDQCMALHEVQRLDAKMACMAKIW